VTGACHDRKHDALHTEADPLPRSVEWIQASKAVGRGREGQPAVQTCVHCAHTVCTPLCRFMERCRRRKSRLL